MSLLVHTLTYLHRFSEEVQSTRLYYFGFLKDQVLKVMFKNCQKAKSDKTNTSNFSITYVFNQT